MFTRGIERVLIILDGSMQYAKPPSYFLLHTNSIFYFLFIIHLKDLCMKRVKNVLFLYYVKAFTVSILIFVDFFLCLAHISEYFGAWNHKYRQHKGVKFQFLFLLSLYLIFVFIANIEKNR